MGASAAIIGAQATMAAASAYGEHKAGKTQATISKTEAKIEHAKTEHELSRTAAVQSEEFRRNLASTVASASGRGGAGMVRQFGSQAFASYSEDMKAIERAYKLNDIRKQNAYAQANALKGSTTLRALTGFGKSVVGAGSQQAIYNKIAKSGNAPRFAPASDIGGTDSGKWDPIG